MRTQSNLKIICEGCGSEVVFANNSDQSGIGNYDKKSRVEFNSAFEIGIVLCVKPCRVCVDQHKRPIEMLKQVLKDVQEL